MRTSFLEYSMSVIVSRALPDVRDGLKPVHRRILYAMNDIGLVPTKPHKKSAQAVGEIMGKYHPHGDAAIYDTLVRLAQDFSMRVPLIDGHGNFGSVDGDPPAAMRYTEARLQKGAMEMLRDLDKDTVDFVPNYDESLTEPSVLPARFPNLLVNGSNGIAVGMATNIPPHNLGEAIDATCMLIDNPEATVDDLMTVMPGPDFPTGGTIIGKEVIREIYETGRGSIVVRAKAHLEQTSTGKTRIIVTELPYTVNKAKLHEKIAELARDKKLPEIVGIRDESDRKGMRLVIDLRKDAIAQVVLNKLYKHTNMQNTFGAIMIALVDGVPRTLSLKEILHHYIKHQEDVIVRRTRFDLKKAEERAHILEGLIIALDNIDEVIHIIRSSKDDREAGERLMARFGLSQAQTDAILEMRLKRLTGLERDKIETELAELLEKIEYYKQVLANEWMVLDIIKSELQDVKARFNTPRRTELTGVAKELDVEDLIADEDMAVTITHAGYVKRLPVVTYRQQKRGGKGLQGVNLKESDFVEHLFIANTHDYILFFSTKGKVYRLKVHELPTGTRHSRGTAIVNLLPFEGGEKIAAVFTTKDFPETEYLVFATEHGMVKKTDMSQYNRSRRDGIIAINLRDGDSLTTVRRVTAGQKLILVSSAGKAIKFDESEVRPMGRDTSGVRGMTVTDGAKVLGLEVEEPGSSLFVITDKGYGKQTSLDEYPEKHRGGQGVYTITMTDRKGHLAAMKVVRPTNELMIISEEGVIIRVKSDDISRLGRATQGVKVMNMTGKDRVSAIARVTAENTKKRKKSTTILDGQEALLAEDPETLRLNALSGADDDIDEEDLLDEILGEGLED
ncbi:MAG: DNA gyrase subunit A [Coriobacteriales bacterium]|nr:DNA gyrase subunit A [Coriobacteriales bacterium]